MTRGMRRCANTARPRADNEDDRVTVTEILANAIKQERQRMTQIDQKRVIAILRSLHYLPCQFGREDARRRGWKLVEP